MQDELVVITETKINRMFEVREPGSVRMTDRLGPVAIRKIMCSPENARALHEQLGQKLKEFDDTADEFEAKKRKLIEEMNK